LRVGVLVLVAAASLSGACGGQERSIVDEFFAQSRLRDKTALQKIATVTFEPHIQGIVETFDVTNVTPEENDAKTVTVSAQVKMPDGTIVHKTIVLTMSRGIITGFVTGSPAIPRS
jgi:hypothetical protein